MPTTAYYSNDEDLASGRKYLGGDVNYIKWTPGTRIKKGQLGLGGNAVIPNSAYYGGQALGGYDAEGTANEIQKYQGLNNATATANLQYAPQINPISSKIQGIQASMADAARQAEAQRLAANNLSLDNVNQIRRLQDSNRGRTNETMNTRGLMNSGINDYAQGQINAAEGAGLRNNQAQLSQTLKGIQDWLSGVQQTGQGNVADLESQKAGLLAQVPQLAQSIYDKQQSDAAAAKFEQDQAIAKLMGFYQGEPTLAGQEFTRAGQQADRTFGLQEGELLGNYQGLPTLGRERMNQDVNQFYQKQAQDESQFGRSNAIAQQRANYDTEVSTGGGIVSGGSMPKEYSAWVNDAATQNGIPPAILAGLIEAESSWNPTAVNKTSGATGLGQFLKTTGDEEGVNRTDAKSSIYGAAAYLAKRIQQAGSLEGGVKGYGEGTDEYLQRVLAKAKNYTVSQGTAVKSDKKTDSERTRAATADAITAIQRDAPNMTRAEFENAMNSIKAQFINDGVDLRTVQDVIDSVKTKDELEAEQQTVNTEDKPWWSKLLGG